MSTDGTHRSRPWRAQGAGDGPGGIPGQRGAAPAPHPFVTWLRTPRPAALPGIWRFGHAPRPAHDPDRLPHRQLLGGALLSLLGALFVWSLYRNGVIPFRRAPLEWVTPDSWWEGDDRPKAAGIARSLYDTGVFVLVCWIAARGGQWQQVVRRYVEQQPPRPRAWTTAAAAGFVLLLVWTGFLPLLDLAFTLLPQSWLRGGDNRYLAALVSYAVYAVLAFVVLWPLARLGHWAQVLRGHPGPPAEAGPKQPAEEDPADWPQLRAAGLADIAARLAHDTRSGTMTDVDHARIGRAWQGVQAQPARQQAFASAVTYDGAAACPHPSGLRDLPVRRYEHDLRTGQVRIGTAPDSQRNPHAFRGAGIALEPGVLGTGLVVVGPPAAGKTGRVVAPVVESLCLQALAGQAAVVAVGAPGQLGPDEAYDVVVRIGDESSPHDLDLYGGTNDPDEAAVLLAEALLGGETPVVLRQAVTALAQLLGAYAGAYGRFPAVPELRALLDHDPAAFDALREAAPAAAARDLEARERQAGRAGDVGPLLADRLAVLDRPAFARFFDTSGRGRQFSMRALEYPMRVRIDLPERGHAEASRLLARLVLAQFTAAVPARADHSLFAALVLDDASATVTPGTIRGVQRLRTAHAGVVLSLRSMDEVPEALRSTLLAAAGCRMALSGVSTWDGRLFAEAWGAEWVETRDVTHTPDYSGGVLRRALRSLRRLVTGAAVTTESVTVRKVQRERWSASDLANALPPGHGVLSVTTVAGERTPPVLVNLLG
ncbi:hypothetical protein AB0M28_13855 [Streptomyces sp. NPDC051940]|uniref:hypothetical protein n=1 Tax=Streptomyces sp. NPDC051940 TaxID=3155675 RepID=UPI0034389FD8